MKKLFEEDDHEQDKMERARILMAVIPVVLILLILAFMLIKSRIGQGREDKEDLQQSIMDYADEKMRYRQGTDAACRFLVGFGRGSQCRSGRFRGGGWHISEPGGGRKGVGKGGCGGPKRDGRGGSNPAGFGGDCDPL